MLLLIFTLLLILIGEGIAGDNITLKTETVYSHNHPISIAVKRDAELIKRRNNVEIIPEFYPSSQLRDNNEITEGLITGSINMSIGGAHNIAEHYSEIGITVGPYIFRDFDHAYNVMDGEIGQYLNNNLI